MKKIIIGLVLLVSFIFASIDFQTASKDEMMKIKGIGAKKAQAIIDYRKTNKINSIDDLKNIKGFGAKLIEKIKKADNTKGNMNLEDKKNSLKDKAMNKMKF